MPEGVNVMPVNVPIGTQYSHAAGIAYALKLQGKKNVAVTFIGDGGTSEGEFYEAMNIASVNNWPVVFCVNNNQ
jgi:pyruvate dehydrogenase E1 component alpha subunit